MEELSKWPRRPSLRHMSTSLSEKSKGDCAECANVRAEMAELREALEKKIEALTVELNGKFRLLGEAVIKAGAKADKCRSTAK